MTVRPVGDQALLVEVPSLAEVHRLWRLIRTRRPPGVEDAVAGARSLLLVLADDTDRESLTSLLAERPGVTPGGTTNRSFTIPVVYDGPDLPEVAEAAGATVGEVIRLHSGPIYTVGFLGFSPGFAYLFGGSPRLALPRLDSPRRSVPAGSVALAADMTAVYPQATPGGWRLIGRTDVTMFDPRRPEPALLAPGDLVRFTPVEELGSPPGPPPGPRLAAAAPALEVIDPGALLTIQDTGRRGWAHAGVPVAGAADLASARRANQLAGNPPGAALLEATVGRCRLRLRRGLTVAVTGAEAELAVDGLPARGNVALPLPAGSELTVGPCRRGLRVYVAIAGGIEVEPVLGSRSTDTLSGIGPPPLERGDVLAVAAVSLSARTPSAAPPPPPPLPRPDVVLRVTGRWGPRPECLTGEGRATFRDAEFAVAALSDRTGVRLDGPTVAVDPAGEVASEGVVAGSVQLPPGGQPIVLMRNHPPTGGYPVVAVVDADGVDALAQSTPGQKVRFELRDQPGGS